MFKEMTHDEMMAVDGGVVSAETLHAILGAVAAGAITYVTGGTNLVGAAAIGAVTSLLHDAEVDPNAPDPVEYLLENEDALQSL